MERGRGKEREREWERERERERERGRKRGEGEGVRRGHTLIVDDEAGAAAVGDSETPARNNCASKGLMHSEIATLHRNLAAHDVHLCDSFLLLRLAFVVSLESLS